MRDRDRDLVLDRDLVEELSDRDGDRVLDRDLDLDDELEGERERLCRDPSVE